MDVFQFKGKIYSFKLYEKISRSCLLYLVRVRVFEIPPLAFKRCKILYSSGSKKLYKIKNSLQMTFNDLVLL